jgi:cell wall-associated NlpC family hydrolase
MRGVKASIVECPKHGGNPPMSCPVCIVEDPSRRTPIGLDVWRTAKSLVGTRYVIEGRTRRGVDCVGLCVLSRASVGLGGDFLGYSKNLDGVDVLSEIGRAAQMDRDIERSGVGDVIVFEIGGRIQHLGILGDDGRMAMSSSDIGVFLTKLDHRWSMRAVARVAAKVRSDV